MVAAVTEGGFIGGAKDRCIVFVTDVALDLHGLKLKVLCEKEVKF